MQTPNQVVRLLADLALPPRCMACEGSCRRSDTLCPRCRGALERARPVFTAAGPIPAWSRCGYDGAPRAMVVALKFGGRLPLAAEMASAIVAAAPSGMLDGALTPVPAAPSRLRRRGFDPALELARAIAGLTGAPLCSPLIRTDRQRQVGRPRVERIGSPPVMRAVDRSPARVVVIDDVITTGATVAACGAALHAAGARNVRAVSFAWSEI